MDLLLKNKATRVLPENFISKRPARRPPTSLLTREKLTADG
jgi:hypothetical protein